MRGLRGPDKETLPYQEESGAEEETIKDNGPGAKRSRKKPWGDNELDRSRTKLRVVPPPQ